MKRMMSIMAIALFVAGSSVFACDTCGCKDKKADAEKACCAKKDGKCAADCAKECCAPKAKEEAAK